MKFFVFLILIILFFYFIKSKHIKFNLKSFKYKGVKTIDDKFGVYLITGKQGTNKTYYACQLILNQNLSRCNYVKTNIHSLKIPGVKMVYFTKINEIYFDTDINCIYIIDELSRKYKKNTPCDENFFAFMNQCRKRNRILIGITQEYLELPMWLRRPCRYMLSSKTIPILSNIFNIFACEIGNGYDLVYDKDVGEYVCPTLGTIIYKRNEYVSSLYDTFEPINEL